MASYNKITLIGNVGRDPEIKTVKTNNGDTKVAEFSIAVNDKRTDQTDWYRVTFWRRLAEIVESYVKKGMPIYVEGRLAVREYTDGEGKNRYSLEVTGSEMQMLGSKNDNLQNDDNAPKQTVKSPTAKYNAGKQEAKDDFKADNSTDADDDLPF